MINRKRLSAGLGSGYVGRVEAHTVKKIGEIMGNILESVFFLLFSLFTFPTGGYTMRGVCVFSRYILISIILVSYTIDRYRNRFKKTTVA